MDKKRIAGFVIIGILTVLAAVLLEAGLGNYRAWTQQRLDMSIEQPEASLGHGFVSGEFTGGDSGPAYTIEVGGGEGYNKLSEEEEKQILIARENRKILAQVNGVEYEESGEENIVEQDGGLYRRVGRNFYTIQFEEPVYVEKAALSLPELDKGTYCYVVAKLGGKTVYEVQDGYVDQRLGTRIFQPGQKIDGIQFEISNEDLIEVNAVGIRLWNQFRFNGIRFMFFFVLCLIAVFLLYAGNWFARKPENIYAVMSLLLGGLLILGIGTNQVGYDEHTHAKQAYNFSFGSTVLTTESAMQMEAGTLPSFYNLEERGLAEAYEDINNDYSWANITTQSRFPAYDVRSYYPIAVFLKLGRVLKLPFAWNMMLGRFGNLALFTALLYLAVRYAKAGKTLIAALGLLPNNLFAAAGITYDGVVNAFLILAVTLTLNLIYAEGQEEKLNWRQTLVILGAYVVGSTAKPIYIIMALMLLFLPGNRFVNGWRKWVFRAAVLALAGLMVYTIFFPPVSADSNYELIGNLAYAGDKRNQGTSVLGQLQYILMNFGAYLKLLLSSMLGDLAAYLSGTKKFLNYGYLGELEVGWTWLALVLTAFAALFSPADEVRHGIGRKYVILNLVMVFGVSAVIWTSMYVSFTPVGADAIQGVQARYFIPVFLPFFLCLLNGRLKVRLNSGNYTKLILGGMALINLYAVWILAIVARNS